jgi:RimJ/RimL family protein N-acetyltransferase
LAEVGPIRGIDVDRADAAAIAIGPPSSGRARPSRAAPPDVEIGWHLHSDAWGHDYATEAAAAPLHDAFRRGLTRIIAVTDLDNHASQAVCRRLGMTHIGRTTR